MAKREFEITVQYFKPSGKYYAEGSFKREFTDCVAECSASGPPVCYMTDVVDLVRGWRDDGSPGLLPGLSGGWDGYILVDCEHGFPCLIIPRGKE